MKITLIPALQKSNERRILWGNRGHFVTWKFLPLFPALSKFKDATKHPTVYPSVHRSSLHDNQETEATYMPTEEWIKTWRTYIYNGILVGHNRIEDILSRGNFCHSSQLWVSSRVKTPECSQPLSCNKVMLYFLGHCWLQRSVVFVIFCCYFTGTHSN